MTFTLGVKHPSFWEQSGKSFLPSGNSFQAADLTGSHDATSHMIHLKVDEEHCRLKRSDMRGQYDVITHQPLRQRVRSGFKWSEQCEEGGLS